MAVRASLPPFPFDNASAMEWPEGGTVLPFASSFQQQPVQQHQHQQQLAGSIPLANSSYPCMAPPPTDLSYFLAALMERERQEIDQYLRLQSVWLRANLVRQTNQQAASLLAALDSKGSALLRRKDEELAEARRRSVELEELMRNAERMKNDWERAAQKHEAEALGLGKSIERLEQPSSSATGPAGEGDGASCSDVARKGGERATGRTDAFCHPCRSCWSRDSCVMVMPCRHLCSCKHCAPLLVSCPVCVSVKSDSLEVLLAWE